MEKKPNPIEFNPVVMPVRDVMQCAEHLRMLFDMVNREVGDEGLANAVRGLKEYWERKQ